jgi:hypothetical protein
MSEVLNTQQLMTPSNFQFSGADMNDLGATGYTLATICLDISTSVRGFKQELEDTLKTVVESCKNSPRSENLLVRLVTFNSNVEEKHGFRVLDTISLDEYDGTVNPSGATALYDAVQSSVEATYEYGKLLADQDYEVNGVVYVITDGADCASRCTPTSIKNYIAQESMNEEGLESMSVILIGVGYGGCATYLDNFKQEADLNQFIDIEELFAKTSPDKALAKLAGYISRSISTTSMALQNGTSGPDSSSIVLLF